MKNPENASQSTLAKGTHFEAATEALLTPANLEVPQLQQVLGEMMSHHIDYADLYFQYSRAESWSLEEGQVKSGNFSIDQGVGVRAVSGEKTAFAYSDDITFDALQLAAKATKSIAKMCIRDSLKSLRPLRHHSHPSRYLVEHHYFGQFRLNTAHASV